MTLEGPIPVLPTCFHDDESIDLGAMDSLIRFAKNTGITAVCLPAFGSEFYKLSANERTLLLQTAIQLAGGELCVVAQCNHAHAPIAAQMAREAEAMGCGAISTALPRAFPVAEQCLVDHAVTVCRATSLPVILQDWNPGGESLSVAAAAKAKSLAANLACLKLEEPGVAAKIRAITEATGGSLRVLGGWGGLYLMEQLPAGVAGLMPGIPLIDVFQAIWHRYHAGDPTAALSLFKHVLPYIEFSLRTFEQFHHAEKTLAAKRGLLPNARVRSPSLQLDEDTRGYLDFLTDSLLEALLAEGFVPCPLKSA
jgi:4-hydroxy-tetrahydrodipicolinate synthase